MKKLIFATTSKHKLTEIRAMLPGYDVLGLEDIGYHTEIEETGLTLEENATIKALQLYSHIHEASLGEDTGLEVFALDMAPGVHTARYAGNDRDPAKNMDKLLEQLTSKSDRRARFRTVIALADKEGIRLFEGIVNGTISEARSGAGGFGYDPVFIPEGYDKTFAELPSDIKNNISHRAMAVQKLVSFLASENPGGRPV